jgi:hypothetical protein
LNQLIRALKPEKTICKNSVNIFNASQAKEFEYRFIDFEPSQQADTGKDDCIIT